MSMKDYSISWSDALIGRVETYLRDIHAALAQHYKEHGYESRAPAFQRSGNTGESSGECHDSNEDKTAGSATQSTVDVISSAGSFLQRTCVHSVPYASLHTPRMPIGTHAAHATPNELRHGGAGADLVLTIPGARCSVQDMREGRYLLRRRAFVSEVEEYLRAIVDRAARRMQQRRSAHHTDSSVNHGENADEEDGEEDDSSRGSDTGEKEKGFMSAAASRLARMRVHRLPIHGCYGNAVKDMLCISIARANRQADARHNNRSSSSSSSSHVTANAEAAQTGSLDCEVFVINIHFRPAMYCARAMNAEAARRHPCYTYCLLEDYHMPDYLTMLHTLCVQSNSLRQAIVLLKCWAHHVGLMAAASGHSEGLNGFIVAALVFYLYEEGVLTAHMSAESVVRMVWVQISRAILTPNKDVSSIGSTVTTTRERPTDLATATAASVGVGGCVARNSKMPVPVAEECGEVAVLRLRGEVLNILFRSSAQFVRHVVQPAADEALQFALSHEVFAQLVFTPLPLRYDAALVVHQEQANHDNSNQTSDTSDKLTECSTSRKSKPNEDGSKAIDARESREDADEESARMMLRGKGDIFSPSVQRAHDMQVILQRAFVHRIAFCSVWPISADRMQVIVSLSNESDGRSRLTRGPAIEQTAEVAAFNAFWGESVTSTRQLPDGAIYRCVLWNFPHDATQQQLLQQLALSTTATTVSPNITSNAHDNANAASASSALPLPPLCAPIVLRHITEYILRRHTDRHTHVRILLGELDGVLCERVGSEWVDVAPISQPTLHRALRHVEQLMTRIGAAALPCKVTGFDVIAASARHTEVFPIRPHLALTRQTDLSNGKVPPYLSTAATISPVHCVLTIDDSGCKIPDTPEAIRVMRGAICAQLAKAMEHAAEKLAREEAEAEADFRQPSDSHSVHNTKRGAITTSKTHPKCTGTEQSEPNRMSSIYTMCTQGWTDIIHAGYLFRVHVAHYREVALLRALQRDAEAELMEQKLFWSVQHHKMIRAVAIGHASYSAAVRIAKRWLSAMLLSEFVLCEAVELLVAYAYVRGNNTQTRSGSHAAHASSSAAMASMSSSSSNTSYQTPRTAACGFVHFLHLLATHDWTQPLRLSNEEVDLVDGKSDTTHHPVSAMSEHQAMFISAPYAPQQSPFTRRTPRALILHRLVQLAQSALMTLLQRRQLGVGDEPVILDDCVAQADTRHAVSHCCSLQHEQRCACRKGGAAEHAHGGAKEGLDVRTESALFRCSPRGFDLVMELHPQLILQPDRALPVSSWAAAEHNSRSRSNCVAGQIGHCGVECASSASSSWTSAAHAGSAGAVTFCGDVARAPTRVYQLDELDERGRRAYLSQLAEREPAAYAIRNARAALRDVGMIFYDALAPRLVYAVGVSGGESVSVRQMQKMYVELMHAGRGALLPTPVWVNAQQRAGTSPSSRVLSTAAAQAKATVPADELQSLPQRRKKHTGNQSTTAAAAAATKRVSPRVGMRRARSAKDDVALTKRLKTSRSMREEEAAVTAAPLVTKRVKSDAKVNATKVERVRCVAEKNTASIEARSAKRKNRSKSRGKSLEA